MPFGDGPDNRESETAARFVGVGAAIEAVEDAFSLLGGNSGAGIVDLHEGAESVVADRHVDLAAGWGLSLIHI